MKRIDNFPVLIFSFSHLLTLQPYNYCHNHTKKYSNHNTINKISCNFHFLAFSPVNSLCTFSQSAILHPVSESNWTSLVFSIGFILPLFQFFKKFVSSTYLAISFFYSLPRLFNFFEKFYVFFFHLAVTSKAKDCSGQSLEPVFTVAKAMVKRAYRFARVRPTLLGTFALFIFWGLKFKNLKNVLSRLVRGGGM